MAFSLIVTFSVSFITSNTTLVSIIQIIFICIAFFFYDAGIGLVFWTVAVEIMEPSYKHIGQQITMVTHFVTMGTLVYLLTLLQDKLGNYIFLIFIITNMINFVYVYFRGVETRNRPSILITEEFSRRSSYV